MNTFAVFGNPIKHSQSPKIHAIFSSITNVHHPYGRMMASLEFFEKSLQEFFILGGMGANITMPFKERAFSLCDKLTERALLANSVNTIKKLSNGSLLGDNTDGVGLLNDLQRLDWLNQNSRVLLVGAGGAARGVIPPLLSFGCRLVLTNRTFSRAVKLVGYFHHLGDITAVPLAQLEADFDLIINATTTGVDGTFSVLSSFLITPTVCCYDMFYQDEDTPFISWCRAHGAKFYADGLGMLVGQAAYSFLLWHGILPPIFPVLEYIRPRLPA